METRDLQSFLAVLRHGSFTAAAQELGYTQSAVSQQIAALERDFGQRLIHRRPVGATSAGERLAEHAARLLLRLDVARSELAHLDAEAGELVVAVCPLAAPWLLAEALRHVRAATPRLRVTVRSIEPGSAVAEIASGGVDLALVDGIAGPDEPLSLTDSGLLSSSALVVSPLAVVLARNHPLAQRSSIDLDVLADAPWIATPGLAAIPVQPRPPTCRSGTTSPAGTEPPMGPAAVTYQGNDLPTLFALVAAGHGAALLPAPACHHAEGIAVVPLAAPQLVHRTEVLTLRGGSLRFRPLLEALRTVIQSMAT